jgi:hypothetical protein
LSHLLTYGINIPESIVLQLTGGAKCKKVEEWQQEEKELKQTRSGTKTKKFFGPPE